jgi:hypothetical protein
MTRLCDFLFVSFILFSNEFLFDINGLMNNQRTRITLLFIGTSFAVGCSGTAVSDGSVRSASAAGSLLAEMPDPTGGFTTFSTTGTIDTTNPFFQSLGGNGRACVHCHQAQDGWGLTPPNVQARFEATTPKGTDPVFRPVDGANSPVADVSTESARRAAYSMLLTKGLIRVQMPIPANAEFTLDKVDDPYGWASAAGLSLFRRPLPATNLKFLATVMWDGRETVAGQTIDSDLLKQSGDATIGHAEAPTPPTAAVMRQIVDFEESLFTAATTDNAAALLSARHANGGPQPLAQASFYIGINDVLGNDPNHVPFSPDVFAIYASWAGVPGGGVEAARASVARGETMFNNRAITLSQVPGVTEIVGDNFIGTCTTCHDTPSSGNHSVGLPVNLGLTDAARRTADMPLYTLRQKLDPTQTVQTTDPGRALVTGRWADIGKFKGPILRGLAARAPYFHNGFAATLDDVVAFYDARFNIGFTPAEHADLVAFLRTL